MMESAIILLPSTESRLGIEPDLDLTLDLDAALDSALDMVLDLDLLDSVPNCS